MRKSRAVTINTQTKRGTQSKQAIRHHSSLQDQLLLLI
jgi:hypothetical protein